MNKEIWKDIEGYDGDYQVSNQGRVMSLKFGKIRMLKLSTNRYGYFCVNLYKRGGIKSLYVARLVAQYFLPSWDECLQIDHINGVKKENHIENLRMVTPQMNRRGFSKKKQGCTSRFRGVHWCKNYKKWRVEMGGKKIGQFDDEEEAARAYNKAAINEGFNPEALNQPKPNKR